MASHECVDREAHIPGTPKEASHCSLELTPNFTLQDCGVDSSLPSTLVEMKTGKPLGRKAGKQRTICKLK